jgi:uncharacterized protein YjiS (DUF1127 family)
MDPNPPSVTIQAAGRARPVRKPYRIGSPLTLAAAGRRRRSSDPSKAHISEVNDMALIQIASGHDSAGKAASFGYRAAISRRVREWLRRRQIAASCGTLSDARLRDIGLTPADLAAASGLPLGQDAGQMLAMATHEPAKW